MSQFNIVPNGWQYEMYGIKSGILYPDTRMIIKGSTVQFGTDTRIFYIACYRQLIFKFMIINIITSVLVGFFVLTLLSGIIEVAYNLKNSNPTESRVWIVPSIFAMAIWFCSHL